MNKISSGLIHRKRMRFREDDLHDRDDSVGPEEALQGYRPSSIIVIRDEDVLSTSYCSLTQDMRTPLPFIDETV